MSCRPFLPRDRTRKFVLCAVVMFCAGFCELPQSSAEELAGSQQQTDLVSSPSGLSVLQPHNLRNHIVVCLDPAANDFYSLSAFEPQSRLAGRLASMETVPDALAKELLVHPALLQPVPRKTILGLYRAGLDSCPDTVLYLLGSWVQSHPQSEPDFNMGSQNASFKDYYEAAYSMVQRHPSHLAVLEREYLVLPDGGCCLPAAYILATGHFMKGQIEEWIEKLNSCLKDGKLKGDQRVTWLIARAWTEEIHYAAVTANQFPRHNFLAGRGWLEEASILVGLSEAVRLRAYKELASKLATDQQFDAAKKLLKRAGGRCSSSTSIGSLARWQQEIDRMARDNVQTQTTREVVAQEDYWNDMRARYRKAIYAGDQDEIMRYKKTMSKAGIEP